MAGIGAQELFILIFFGLAIRFHYKMNYVEAIHPPLNPWRPLIYTVYAGLILITVRIIFRLCEYSQGVDTPLAKNEAALYVLDITTMFIAILFFNIFHPGWYLAGPESEFPKKEKKQNKDVQPEKRRRFWSKEKGGDAESNTELEMFHMQEPDYRP